VAPPCATPVVLLFALEDDVPVLVYPVGGLP
jgi:hypothetical protein